MPSTWRTLGDSPDVAALETLVSGVRTSLDGVAAALDVVSAALDVSSGILQATPNTLDAIVAAVLADLQRSVQALLSHNVAYAVHVNLHWNPAWRYQRPYGADPARVPDFATDRELPWVGTGLRGWLLEMAKSAADPTNPLRPVTTSSSSVQGVIFVQAVPADGEIQDLVASLSAFTDVRALRSALTLREKLQSAGAAYRAALRLGPAILEATVVEAAALAEDVPGAAKGTLIAAGSNGSAYPGTATVALNTSAGDVAAGDVLTIPGDYVYYSVVSVGADSVFVSPPVARGFTGSWEIRRGGYAAVISGIPQDLHEFLPKPGSYPMWMSIPVVQLVPPVSRAFQKLDLVARMLNTGDTQATALAQLSVVLEQKADVLREVLADVSGLLARAEEVMLFFSQAYVLALRTESGGVPRFFQEAISAQGLPELGERSVVIGLAALTQDDDAAAHMEDMFSALGITFASLTDDTTARTAALQATWGAALG